MTSKSREKDTFAPPALAYPSNGLVSKGISRSNVLQHRAYEVSIAADLQSLMTAAAQPSASSSSVASAAVLASTSAPAILCPASRRALNSSHGNPFLVLLTAPVDSEAFRLSAELVNHSYYWKSLSPTGGVVPSPIVSAPQRAARRTSGGSSRESDGLSSQLARRIRADFGDMEKLHTAFAKTGVAHQGVGWLWLVLDRSSGTLHLLATQGSYCPAAAVLARHSSTLASSSSASSLLCGSEKTVEQSVWAARVKVVRDFSRFVPLLAVDLWEHAYVRDFGATERAVYLECCWHALNWSFASQEYEAVASPYCAAAAKKSLTKSHL